MPEARARLVICEHCDAVYRRRGLARGESAHCLRCGALLYRHRRLCVETVFALSLAGLVVWVMANAWPMIRISAGGVHAAVTLMQAVIASWQEHIRLVSVLAVLTLMLAPLLQLLVLAWLCGFTTLGRRPPGLAVGVRLLVWLRPWGMIEVLVLGLLVATVKLHSVFEVQPGIAMWSFAALMMLLAWTTTWDARVLWDAHEGGSR